MPGRSKTDESYMSWAIALALEGMGRTSPNPMVGAVVVKGDRIVGEGYHRRAGTPHAEIHALKAAGKKAKGADLYVTLEPCVHHGRTPPCVPAIIEAGIKRVFVGTRDPNPLVNGRGAKALKKAGIKVIEHVNEESCKKINEPYNKFISRGVPFVTAKVALSLDGKMATESGDSKWITNEDCRRYVHKLRSQVDAVIIGGNTARKDNPRLDVRYFRSPSLVPRAVVVDEALNLPSSLKLLKRMRGELIVAVTNRASLAKIRRIERMGHEVIICRPNSDGRVNLPHMLKELGKLGITSVLVEGGGNLFADFFRHRLVDRLVACIAPKIIGGEGLNFLPGIKIGKIKNATHLKDVTIQNFGDNIVIEGSV